MTRILKVFHYFRVKLADKQLRRWLSRGLSILSIGFLLVILLRDSQSLQEHSNWSDYLGVSFIAFLLYLIALIAQLGIWSDLMRSLGQVRHGWWNVEIFFYSYLIRRLPGTVWYIMVRASMYQNYGVHASVTVVASSLEWILLFMSSVLLFGVLILMRGYGLLLTVSVLFISLFICTFLLKFILQGTARVRLPARFRDWQARVNMIVLPGRGRIFVWLVLECLSYAVGGAMILVLAHGIEPRVELDLMYTTAVWAAVGGLGTLLSLIIPVNLGVRELTLSALLSLYLTPSSAVLVSILLRIVFVLGDLVWGAGGWLVAHAIGRKVAVSPEVNIGR